MPPPQLLEPRNPSCRRTKLSPIRAHCLPLRPAACLRIKQLALLLLALLVPATPFPAVHMARPLGTSTVSPAPRNEFLTLESARPIVSFEASFQPQSGIEYFDATAPQCGATDDPRLKVK